jgi:hexosaminidase
VSSALAAMTVPLLWLLSLPLACATTTTTGGGGGSSADATAAAAAAAAPWPRPASHVSGADVLPLGLAGSARPPLVFSVLSGGSADLEAATTRYLGWMFPHGGDRGANGSAVRCDITIAMAVAAMGRTTDESYTIRVPAATAAPISIDANTTIGAYRALETLSQLVDFDFDTGIYAIHGVPLLISDSPRFAWRGLMIDTSRHWLPVPSIERTIEALSFAKMNVLHWHISDRESFPLQLESAPTLALGSWSAAERYSAADVRRIVEYARVRGVRVVPEIDLPTHTASWCVGMPELCPHAPVHWNQSSGKGSGRFDCGPCSPCEPLDPTSPAVWATLKAVFLELAGLFPDGVFHTGGDEV